MRSPLTEDDLPRALSEFTTVVLDQFRTFGFAAGDAIGVPKLKIADTLPSSATDEDYNGRNWFRKPEWKNTRWPHANSRGVYVFFSEDRVAQYVGKAEATLGNRLSYHAGTRGPDGLYPYCAFIKADYVITVPFETAPFLAPAFESFLLARYDFPENIALARE